MTRIDAVRRGLAALALAGLLAGALAGGAVAQDEDVAAGTGGTVNGNAAGGTVSVGGNFSGNVDAGAGTVNGNASGGCTWFYDPFTDLYYCA